MNVVIGVDPHKASHTAVAIDEAEDEVSHVKVRATRRQVEQLVRWAEPFEKRRWAIESAGGTGYLLAQQLVAQGEEVLDVPATLASRIRVLATGRSNKNDPNDAHSIAVAAFRAPNLRSVEPADHSQVLRLLAKRNVDLGSHRTRVVCRLHALLAELAPGGIAKELYVSDAERFLANITPQTAAEQVRHDMALELLDDVRRLDVQTKASHRRIRLAIKASGTSLTEIYGVGPIVAAQLIGYAGDVRRFANRDAFASYNGTAPVNSPRVDESSTASLNAGTAGSTTRCTWLPSPRSVMLEQRDASISNARSPRARPRKRLSAHSSARSVTPSTASSCSTPARGSGRTLRDDSLPA